MFEASGTFSYISPDDKAHRRIAPTALMEYHCNKDSGVAIKIFDLGTKAFPKEAAFAVKYLQFLIQINDENSKHICLSIVLLR